MTAPRAPATGALAAAALLVAGCGGGDERPAASQPARPSTLPDRPARAATQDPLRAGAPRRRLTISVSEAADGAFRYRAPRTAPGGLVEIRLRNRGRAAHKAQLWRVGAGHSVSQARRARRPLPDWLRTAGGVALTAPGRTGRTLQLLTPGLYYVAGTGDQRGEVASFRVRAGAASGSLPPAPARVDAADFRFETSGLRPGRNTIEFRNTGGEPHHAYFAPIVGDADLADVRRFFTTQSSVGAPPVDAERTRETAVLEGGDRQITQLDLDAGRYAVVCFVRNRAGGPPHIELGMINELRVR